MEFVNSENAPKPVGPYSHAVKAEDFVFVSGQIPLTKDGKIPERFEDRVRVVMENIKSILNSCGLGMDSIVKVTVYLKDISKFAEFNDIYSEYIKHRPSRAVVGVSSLPKDVDIEIEAIAYSKS